MRFFSKLIVLGFAALGVYKAWEMLGPRVSEARQRAEDARDTLEPAIRDAADTLQTATKEAAETITEGSGDAAHPAPDAFGAAAEMISETSKSA
jgi:regulator of protease activity HflC (stomatin/prohibitin superfamily)